jgi:PAS domain S-box-containing protein
MNTVLENPAKKIKKFNFIAFMLLFVSVLMYQATILLQNHYITGETIEFGLSNQDRLLSQKIEKNLVSSLTAPDYLSRDRYINDARQDINVLFVNHNNLLAKSLHFPFLHEKDDITRQVYQEAGFYLEQMRDAVFTAVANSEKLEFNEVQQQSLRQAVDTYQENQQLFTNLIDRGTNLSFANAKSYMKQLPWLSWCLAGFIFIVMSLNHRLIYQRSIIAAKNQFHQLEEKLEFQNALLNSAHEAIITISTEGIITLFSASANRMFGYQANEIVGKSICELIPENSSRYCQDCFKVNAFSSCYLINIKSQKIEFQGLRKNGETFPVLLEIEELETARQHVFIGFIRDLTAEKAAEFNLKHSEAKYRAVVEDQTNLICRYDTEFKLSFVNNAYCNYFKKSKEALLGSRFIDELPIDVQQWLQASHCQLSVENPISQHENSIITAEGHKDWMQWTTHAIFDNERLVEYQGIGTITTRQKEAEIKLLHAKLEAEEANKAKSQFLSNMSHELKTPLNAILGFSQLLETDEVEPLSSGQAECVRHIYKAGKLLLALIGDVLDLSKIETGNVKLNIEETSVNEVILEALNLIDNIAKEHHINIKTRFDPLAQTMIKVDGLRFKQILINLLSNAIKYNSENGLITLRSKVEHNRVRVSVKDSGKGIDESKLMELFQPFNRLGAENTDIEGTGIGLCIAKNLVEQMGGSIGVTNNKDVGCCFWIEFPIIPQKATHEEHATELSKKLQDELTYLQDSLSDIGLVKKSEVNEPPIPSPQDKNKAEIKTATLH